MTVQSILRTPVRLTSLGVLLLLGLAGCQDDSSPTGPLPVGPLMDQVASAPVVNSLADPGTGGCDDTECTLREAIAYAESGATITFVPGLTGTITATNEVWLIEKNLTIAGPGATVLALRAGEEGLLRIASGVTAAEISGLTLRDAGPMYPAVINDGILTVRECVVTNNHVSESSYAAGLSNFGTLTIIASTISDNSLTAASYSSCGGAIRNLGTLTVTGSTISGNERSGGDYDDGGGICNGAPFDPGTATLTNSTVSGNTASGVGGGIHNHYESTLTLINSTVTGNKAATGGGINQAGTMTLTNTLLAENTTDYEGNGPDLWINPFTNPQSTISYSLLGSASGNSIVNGTNGNIVGVATADLRLGALEDNGGATWTHALLEESPAIDAGTATGCPATDQRGVTRPQGDACDIGAYEAGGTVPSALVVNSLADPGDGTCDDSECTLREAIASAESGAEITFDPALTSGGSATIRLLSAGPTISKALTITGPGAESLTVSGSGAVTVFFVTGGPVSISGLTITEGRSTNASDGGGITISETGDLSVTDCVITGNVAHSSGGGAYNRGTLTLVGSEVSGNYATNDGGGGIYNHTGAVLDVINSSLTGNHATWAGGIHVYGGQATVAASTISGNVVDYSGGGIELRQGTLTVVNSTVSGNTATNANGGGIYNGYGTATIVLSTITGNRAGSGGTAGGGIHSVNGEGMQTSLKGSIVWGNTLADGTANDVAALNATTRFQSGGYNLIGVAGTNVDVTTDFAALGDQTGVASAGLGALADNGGPTLTHALLTNSPAIDQGTCADHEGNTVDEDQRGVTRPQGDACDIGAYEGGTVTTADELDVTVNASTSITRTYVWEISKGPDATYRGFPGASWEHTYEIEVEQNKDEEAPSYTDVAWSVAGTITIANNTSSGATIESVTDVVSTGIAATVDCGDEVTFPHTLAAGATLECGYASDLPDGTARTNTATVTTSGDVAGDEATADVDFAEAAIVNGNPTVHVTDDYATPDNVADDKKSDALGDGGGFEYAYTFACPTDLSQYTEGVYTDTIVNTAAIDEYPTLSDDATVTVTCYVPAKAKVVKTTTEGDENIGQSPFTFALYAPDSPPGYGYDPVQTVTLDVAGEIFFTTELKDEGPWTVVEVLPAGWVSTTDLTCSFVVDYPPLYEGGNASAAGQTFTCNFANVEQSRVDLLKLTGGVVNPDMSWAFKVYEGPDGFGGTEVAGDNTSGDEDGLLDFDFVDLNPSATYTICELDVAAGYSTFWQIDTDGDGVGDVTVIPYNPNQDEDPPEDLGNRCVDVGTGTGVGFSPGATLHFVVNNAQPGGAPRSNGYWKNWNGCTGGGQAAAAEANGGWPEGFWLLEDVLNPDVGDGVTWDDILSDNFAFPITSCPVAVDILDKRKVKNPTVVADGKKQASDPLFNLAASLLAAQLNLGAGVCTTDEVRNAVVEAENLLDLYNFDGDDHDNLGKKDDNATRANELAAFLDSYNTGMICGNGSD